MPHQDRLTDPETMTTAELAAEVAKLRGERVKLKRQVRALTAGNTWLENAAELFGEVTMRGPGILDAIHKVRQRYLHDRLWATPLCDIERSLYRQGIGAMMLLCVYEMVSPAIVRQLEADALRFSDDPEAAERAVKEPPYLHGTPAAWPGNGAHYGKVG